MVCSIRTECNVRINPSFSTRVVGPETKHLAVAPVALDATHTATSIFNLHVVHVHAVRVYYKVILPHRQALVNSSMMQGGRWTYILTLVCSLSIMYTFVSCLRHFKHTNQPLLYFLSLTCLSQLGWGWQNTKSWGRRRVGYGDVIYNVITVGRLIHHFPDKVPLLEYNCTWS